MKKIPALFILYCVIIFTACQPKMSSDMPDEDFIEQLYVTNCDSLATILENQVDPSQLPEADRMNYVWWLARTHFSQGRSLVNDTLIHEVVDYYKRTRSPRLIQAYRMAAEQVDWSGTNPRGKTKLLEEALETAELYKDTNQVKDISARLNFLYEIEKDTDKVINLIEITKKYGGKQKDVATYYLLVQQYSQLNELDSLFKYASEGIELARQQDNGLLYDLTRTYIEGLNASGRPEEALKQIKKLESNMKVGNELIFNYISTWINMGKLDSALVYIESYQPLIKEYKGHQEIDVVEFFTDALQLVINSKEGRSFNLNTLGVMADNILNKSRKREKADNERQYMQRKLLENNMKLQIERERIKQAFLWSAVVVLLVLVILTFTYQRKLLKKERSVRKAHEQLRTRTIQLSENESIISKNEEIIKTLSQQLDESDELKQEIDQLSANNERLKQENNTLLTDIDHYTRLMDEKDNEAVVYGRLTEQIARLQERERFLTSRLIDHTDVLNKLCNKPKYVDEMQWPEIYHSINQLFDGFTYRLHTDYPTLTDEDIRYCCLIKLHLPNSTISTLTGVSPSSVTKRKQRIKEKMSQQHRSLEIIKDQSLDIYLWNY